MFEIVLMTSDFIKLKKIAALKIKYQFAKSGYKNENRGMNELEKGDAGRRQFKFLMSLHPRGQPMEDCKVDDAGSDQRGTGPP